MSNCLSLYRNIEQPELVKAFEQVRNFQKTVNTLMVKDKDYGVIPGVSKPTLFKPGAEKLLNIMGLSSTFEIADKVEDWDRGLFSYTVRCNLYNSSGEKLTEGLGHCNSREDKYRYRWVKEGDIPVGIDPASLKQNQWGKYRIENDEIFSQVNTILKMAEKRALVDAALRVGSLSDLFTQDIEDMSNFQDREIIENLDMDTAGKIKLTFGKHKGKLLNEVLSTDKPYVEWLSQNANRREIKEACIMLLADEKANDEEKTEEREDFSMFEPTNEDIPF